MQVNVTAARLATGRSAEFEDVGVHIPEVMQKRRRPVRYHLDGVPGDPFSGGAAGVETEPGRTDLVVRTRRAARDAVDAVGESLQVATAGEPGNSLRTYVYGAGLSGRHHAPLRGGDVGQFGQLRSGRHASHAAIVPGLAANISLGVSFAAVESAESSIAPVWRHHNLSIPWAGETAPHAGQSWTTGGLGATRP